VSRRPVAATHDGTVRTNWFSIVRDDTCPECGLAPSSVPAIAIGAALVEEASCWAQLLLSHADSPSLTTQPATGVWSALEYGGHARDTLLLFDGRIRLALTADNPRFDYQDQDAEVRDGRYNEADPTTLAQQIVANAQQFKSLLETLSEAEWHRTGTRLEGEHFDVTLLARFALHELRHHRVDAERSAFG
jgi:hypothetical protein